MAGNSAFVILSGMTAGKIIRILKFKGNTKKAKLLSGFFKTGKGEYGEGDIFLGINMPEIREVAKQFKDLDFVEIENLLKSKYHEIRMTALLILVYKVSGFRVDDKLREKVFKFYLKNSEYVNNWDLVDVTCTHTIGEYLVNRDKEILYKLAKSKNLWEKRIAIVSTASFIRLGNISETFLICEILMHDEHDLIHKACGWMLREAFKKDADQVRKFLEQHVSVMPRTMLRYAIEKMPKKEREYFMNK